MATLTDSLGNDSLVGGAEDDVIIGLPGNDTLDGGAGNDSISGDAGNDTILLQDGFGNDTVAGSTGNDTIDASAMTAGVNLTFSSTFGNGSLTSGSNALTFTGVERFIFGSGGDTVNGSTPAELIDGGAGNDSLAGGGGNDTILGGTGNDTLVGGVGSDVIDGGDGNDLIVLFAGDGGDTITGGNGTDTISMGLVSPAVTVTFSAPGAGIITGTPGTFTFSGIEVFTSGLGSDSIVGAAGAESIFASNGNDTVQGNDGNDTLDGVAGADQLFGGAGADRLIGGDGADTLSGDAGDDTFVLAGGDSASGGAGDDVFTFDRTLPPGATVTGVGGETGEDLTDPTNIPGGRIGDVLDLRGMTNVTVIPGGAEAGTAVFTNSGGLSITVQYSEVEVILTGDFTVDGTAGNDVMSPGFIDAQGDKIDGNDGVDDVIAEAAGDDTVNAGIGNDTVDGGTGNDSLAGGAGNDSLGGGSGNDLLIGGAGADLLIGGAGIDTVSYAASGVGVQIDLATGTGTGGDAEGDRITGVEVVIGSDFDDAIIGGSANETLIGGDGNDTLTGGAGDVLSGGTGDDVFRFDRFAAGTAAVTVTGGANSANGLGDVLSLQGLTSFTAAWTNGDKATGSGTLTYLNANGNLVTVNFSEIERIICFARGTLITTARGEVPVQDLRLGDLVLTADRGFQPLRWLAARQLTAAELAEAPNQRPIRIRAGALGHGLPRRDLTVSPQHRILIRSKVAERMFGSLEVLVAAKHLLALDGVEVVAECGGIEYWHLMCDRHEVILAEGTEVETLFPGPEAMAAQPRECHDELRRIFPDLVTETTCPAARPLPKGAACRQLVQRHILNKKAMLATPPVLVANAVLSFAAE